MPDPFVPAGPLKINPIYDGRPTADPFSGPRPNGRVALDSSADLFAFVNQGASVAPDRGPYSLTSAQMTRGGKTENVTLVGINGTHLPWAEQAHQSTGIMTDARAGLGIENAYVRSVKADIMKLPPGTKLVIAGHSLGGIVAQELAADPDIKARYEILNTVSFGSPVLKPGRQEGAVHRLADLHDPIPLLSWDGLKSNAASLVQGAAQGAQGALDRAGQVARDKGIISPEMLASLRRAPGDVVAGAERAVSKSEAVRSTTFRDAHMPQGGVAIPGPVEYLSMHAHKQSYADPKAWGGVTALGEPYSRATQATITFKESDVRWRMTEPVNKEKGWDLPIPFLKTLRGLLSEVDPAQTNPDAPGQGRPATRLAAGDAAPGNAAPGDTPSGAAPVSGDRVRAALAMVLRSEDGIPDADALRGTRPEQLAAIHEAMSGRVTTALTPEHSAAVLDLAATLGPEHLDTARAQSAGAPAVEASPTQLAQAGKPAVEMGPAV